MAKKLAKENKAELISSDVLLLRVNRPKEKWDESLKKGAIDIHGTDVKLEGDVCYDYIKAHHSIPFGVPNGDKLEAEVVKFYMWFMKEAKTNPKFKNKKFIVEGCSICSMDPKVMVNQPLIIVGGSRLRSMYRRSKRNTEEKSVPMIQSIFKYIKKYYPDNARLDTRKENFKRDIKKEMKK